MISALVFLLGSQFALAQEGRCPDPTKVPSYSFAAKYGEDAECGCNGYTEVTDSRNTFEADEHGNEQHMVTCRSTRMPISPVQTASSPIEFGAACERDTNNAVNVCNMDKNSEMAAVRRTAEMMSSQMKAASTQSAKGLCSQIADLSRDMDVALGAFSGYCTSEYMSCQSSCAADLAQATAASKDTSNPTLAAQAAAAVSDIKENQKTCNSMAGNLRNVQSSLGNYLQLTQYRSANCKDGLQTDDCIKNPYQQKCQDTNTDCKNPKVAATSPICICRANPADPICPGGSGFQAGMKPGSNRGTGNSTGADGDKGDFGSTGGNKTGAWSPEMDYKPGGPQERAQLASGGQGGGRGGGGGSGGNGQAGGGRGGGSAGGSGASTKVISGYGYGGGMGSAGRGGSGSVAQDPRQMAAQGRLGPNGRPVDLRQFMPGGKMHPSRALAGVSGPDGITGPNSNIWKKINTRYFSVSPSLLP